MNVKDLILVEVRRMRNGKFHWRLTSAANGQRLGNCAEGYNRKAHAMKMAKRLFGNARGVKFVVSNGRRKRNAK